MRLYTSSFESLIFASFMEVIMEILKNNNGMEYTVIAKVQSGNENEMNAYLLKSLTGQYIVAVGWSEKHKCWNFGHYFMDNKEAAMEDFKAEAEKIAWFIVGILE